jgi:hypothetical protein
MARQTGARLLDIRNSRNSRIRHEFIRIPTRLKPLTPELDPVTNESSNPAS